MSRAIPRDEALELLNEWVQAPPLRRHCLAVEASMRAYATRDGEDVELWGVTGLLHDADYERNPDMDDAAVGHPRSIMAELERRDAPPEMVRAIASHAEYMGVERESAMERTLHAVDELSGFLIACAMVRPEGMHGLTPKSVRKKLKQPSFAAAVNRAELQSAADSLDVPFDDHVTFVIAALETQADALGVSGQAAA
ncbi:MAG TPA: HDIG domain-containing protein [Solirubrobacteraceae bacterium]|nr:HDIG domain-containing protein [Solirubrobacteraceae bacterium]